MDVCGITCTRVCAYTPQAGYLDGQEVGSEDLTWVLTHLDLGPEELGELSIHSISTVWRTERCVYSILLYALQDTTEHCTAWCPVPPSPSSISSMG